MRLAHQHRSAPNLTVAFNQLQLLNAVIGFNAHFILVNNLIIVKILAHATDGVAANAAVATVHIVNLNVNISLIRRANHHHAVAANAPVSPAQAHCQTGRVIQLLLQAVEVNIIVAAALHFSKRQGLQLSPQIVNIHQLNAILRIKTAQAVCQHVSRVDRCQAGNPPLHRLAPGNHTILLGVAPLG